MCGRREGVWPGPASHPGHLALYPQAGPLEYLWSQLMGTGLPAQNWWDSMTSEVRTEGGSVRRAFPGVMPLLVTNGGSQVR